MADAPFDVARAHRWFAVELNNYAWDLLEKPVRTEEEAERLIHAAHGSTFHWLHAGDDLNHLRGQCLLANAYAAAGIGEASLRHVKHCLALSDAAGGRQTPFDRATALACVARAYAVCGMEQEYLKFERDAREAANALEDEDERKVLESLLTWEE